MAQEKSITRVSWRHVFGMCGVIFFIATARVHAATLFIDPASMDARVDNTFEVILMVDTQGRAINALEATVVYPIATLTGVSVSQTNSILTVWAEGPTLDATAGTVRLAGGRPSPGFTGVGEIARITFRGRVGGEAAVTISAGSVLANDGSGTELLTARQGSLFTIVTVPLPPPVPPTTPPPEPVPVPGPEPAPEPEPAPAPGPDPEAPPAPEPVPGAPESIIATPPPSSPIPSPDSPSEAPASVPIASLIGEATSFVQAITLVEVQTVLSGVPATLGEVPVTLALPKPVERVVEAIAAAVPAQVSEAVREVTKKIQATKTYQAIDTKVINNPAVEEASIKVALPVLVTAAATNISLGVRIASLFSYLQWLTTQPLFLLTRRKRKRWGMVYGSLTKLPVDLAIVRLFDQQGKLLQTRVTDKQGRYLFFVDAGTYRISVTKPGFLFPSVFLKEKAADLDFTDLYHDELIVVTEKGTAITRPIPVDSIEKTEAPKSLLGRTLKRGFQKTIAWSGPMFAVVSLVITPTRLTFGFLVFQIMLLGLFHRLSERKRPESWGSVVDAITKKPIVFAITRIFDITYNKLLETQISDSRGRYAFLVGKGIFYITVEKPGYESYKSATLDLSRGETEKIAKADIRLTPAVQPVASVVPPVPPSPPTPPEVPASTPFPAPVPDATLDSPPLPPTPTLPPHPPLAPDLDPPDPVSSTSATEDHV